MINPSSKTDETSVKLTGLQATRTAAASPGPEQVAKTTTKCNDSEKTSKQMTWLGATFVPSEDDVICGRGSEARNHSGNLKFRKRVEESAESYSKAPSKMFKSLIVTDILEWVYKQSPGGGFVKRVDGAWYAISEDLAREKIGQGLREMNHSKYKSSMKAKRRRWKQEKQQQKTTRAEDSGNAFRDMMQEHNEAVENKLRSLDDKASDAQVLQLFTQQNNNLLTSLKSDDRIQEQIGKLT